MLSRLFLAGQEVYDSAKVDSYEMLNYLWMIGSSNGLIWIFVRHVEFSCGTHQ